jgi:hypothetical protein
MSNQMVHTALGTVAAIINARLTAAGISLDFDRATPCAHGVMLMVSMQPGDPSLDVIAGAYPGGKSYPAQGYVFWRCKPL